MAEKNIHSVDEALQFISQIMETEKIPIARTEEALGFSSGLISRWKKTKTGPALLTFLDLCNFLNIEIVFRKNSVSESPNQVNGDKNAIVEDNSKLAIENISETSQNNSKSTIDENILECVKSMLSSDTDLTNKKLILDILTSAILLARH